jgi:hypothetical protein
LSTFHHCCADCCTDFFVCTDEYWHLDLILWGSALCQDRFLQGPPIWSHLLPRRFLQLLQHFSSTYVTTTVATDFYRIMLITRSISMMVVLGANMVF